MKKNLEHTSPARALHNAKLMIDSFIQSCSHNLKSPLTSIEGLVMIAEYGSSPEEINRCLDLIQRCAANMQRIIRKLQEYTVNLHRVLVGQEIEAERLVEKVLKEYSEEIVLGSIRMSTKISQRIKWFGDERVYYLILKDLVANALQFFDPAKKLRKVSVKVNVKRKLVLVEVSDNGIGILEEEKCKIFEPFHRSSSRSIGNGLGLFLVKGLAEKLNASISVCSANLVGTSILLSSPNHYLP
jgi:signal transduction histidine kinase